MPETEAEYVDMTTDCYTMTDSGSVKSIAKRRATLALMCACEECRDSWSVLTKDTNIVVMRIARGVLLSVRPMGRCTGNWRQVE